MSTKMSVVALATLLLELNACSAPGTSRSEVPAVVTEPSDNGRNELQEAMSKSLHGAQVTLSTQALTQESFLAVERMRTRDDNGRQLDGRILEQPDIFQLVKAGSDCILIHQGSGVRTRLSEVKCVAAQTANPSSQQ